MVHFNGCMDARNQSHGIVADVVILVFSDVDFSFRWQKIFLVYSKTACFFLYHNCKI